MKIGLNSTCFNNRPSGAKQRFVGLYNSLISHLPEFEFIKESQVSLTPSPKGVTNPMPVTTTLFI